MQRLAQFMGLKSPETVTKPDETYVLTNDNFVKIIGLQMRFRSVKSMFHAVIFQRKN